MMNPVIDTGNLKHYDQLLKGVAGGSLTLSEDGKKFVLKSVGGKVLSEIDAPDAGGDGLKGNKITAALPISEGDIVVYGAHILNFETEEVVEGYMPLKDCHMMASFGPILGATANIAQGADSEDVCNVGKFSVAGIQEMALTVGGPVYIRCQYGTQAITVNGMQLIIEMLKALYPELGELTYDGPDKLTQAWLETYPEAEEGFWGKANDYILLGYAVSETEVLITADHSVFRDTTNGGFVKFVDAANCDGEGNVISSTYAKKSDVTTLPIASSTTLGGVKIGSNITVSSGAISLTKTNVTNALGFTPVATSGARGSLAGYETNGTSTTINASAPDSNQTGSAITVANGSSGTSWTKIVRLTSDVSVTLGSSWQWSGGKPPVIVSGGMLVCCWCGSGGIASFVSPV